MSEFETVRTIEKKWAKLISDGKAGDSGSYSENADSKFMLASQIRHKSSELADLLLAWERLYE